MKNYVRLALTSVSALVLSSGCAHQVVDSYPSHPTAVVKTHAHNMGFKGLFASDLDQDVYTRPDMRRLEDHHRFTGMFMSHLWGPSDSARIWRADKNLLWNLNLDKKTYTECPLAGCPPPPAPPARTADARRNSQPASKPSCETSLRENSFSVRPTGETRVISGFNAKEYRISWLLVAEDKKKRKDTSRLTVDIWTTSENNPQIKSVLAAQKAFERAERGALGRSELGRLIPAEALQTLSEKFIAGLSPAQRRAIERAERKLSRISGYPVSSKLVWYLDSKACQAPPQARTQAASPGLNLSQGLGGLLGSATSWAGHRAVQHEKDEMKDKPVFGYVWELKSIGIAPASDGLFVPRKDFRLVDRS